MERAPEQAKQDGYDIGVAETEVALRAEVSGVCRNYCSQVWIEALNQAEVEASSILRRAKNIYYPLPSELLSHLALGLTPTLR